MADEVRVRGREPEGSSRLCQERVTEMASTDDPTVPVVCAACGTETRVAIDEVAAVVERHNERLHDGEAVACIDPAIRDELASIVADDLDLL